MSRQLPPNQRPRVPPTSDNLYQGTTASTLPLTHSYPTTNNKTKETSFHLKCTGSIRGAPCPLEMDDCFTDEAFIEHSYYDFYDHGYQTSPGRHKEFSYSDDSGGSARLPYYEYDDVSNRRHSRNNFSERSAKQKQQVGPKDRTRVYPNDCDRICTDNTPRCIIEQPTVPLQSCYPKRGPLSRISDRPQSSLSSGTPNSVIYGCGGKCQTFENVCYYFLQVAFTMGILIGISLGIAGWVLRKSAARNLQVLLYIGALLSLVCALLLSIQCNARNSVRLKQKAIRNAKRAPIQLDLLPPRSQQQPLMENGTMQRGVPVTLVQVPGPMLQMQAYDRRPQQHLVEQQGIPWWRRKDLK